jgi:hypothetical protein
MWKLGKLTAAALICFLLLTNAMAFSQNGLVFFNPDTSIVEPGEIFEVNIEVDANMLGVHCYKLTIGFNRNVIELLDVSEGPFLLAGGGTYLFVTDTMGYYDLANCILGAGLYADGPGVVATLQLKAKDSKAISTLEFVDAIFQDENLDTIEVNTGDGIIGDANSDGSVNVSDAVFIINYVFVGGDTPVPLESGEANCDGSVNVSDAVYIINYVFVGGSGPCDPDDNGIPDC